MEIIIVSCHPPQISQYRQYMSIPQYSKINYSKIKNSKIKTPKHEVRGAQGETLQPFP